MVHMTCCNTRFADVRGSMNHTCMVGTECTIELDHETCQGVVTEHDGGVVRVSWTYSDGYAGSALVVLAEAAEAGVTFA